MKLKIAVLTLSLGMVMMALSLSVTAAECSSADPRVAPPTPDSRMDSYA